MDERSRGLVISHDWYGSLDFDRCGLGRFLWLSPSARVISGLVLGWDFVYYFSVLVPWQLSKSFPLF